SSNLSTKNLLKQKLAAVMFGCTHRTINECLSKLLFGLPAGHFVYVRNVAPGLPVFLFNYSDRKLYGIFEATTHGQMNIDPYGWTADRSERTIFLYFWVCVRQQCRPLLENQYKPILDKNYFQAHHFWFELDHDQTQKLLSLLAPLTISRGKPTAQNIVMRETDRRGLPSCSTIQKTELPKPSTSEAENSTPVPNWDTDFPALPSQSTIQKAETLKPPTSGAENLTTATTMNWEAESPALPSCKTMQKKAVLCHAPSSATSVPQNREELETDAPALPSSSTIEEPVCDYQLTSEVEHLSSSSQNGDSKYATVQNTVKWEVDFPDFPSLSAIHEPECSSLKLDSVPLFGTYSSFQPLSDVKKPEQEEFQLIYTKLKKLTLQRNLHNEFQNTPLARDVADSWAESPYSQSDQKSGESSCYNYARSPGSMFYPWIIAELLQEVKELQAFRTAQTEKMSNLENQLVQARLEIQQLKDFIIDVA
ncbi:uncharacterized protein LOC126796723, partial [Argentina anserina]|uniref:uncharacterized protein LOC126796723 n=1 Tax=Argentina anserina TaxID=57926 RepID=UPI00217681D5